MLFLVRGKNLLATISSIGFAFIKKDFFYKRINNTGKNLSGGRARQGAVDDILFIIVFFLSLLICGKVSADAGWQSGGDFQGAVEFGG
ncbi:hypothetical protein ACRGFF_005078, partial [Escherichia coli]